MNSIAPIDVKILEEAADWLMRLHSSSATDADHANFVRWRQSDPEHARAWTRAELLLKKFDGLPPALAMPALDRPINTERRVALAKLAMLIAAVPLGWAAWRALETQTWSADYRTATGQRREIQLADGTQLTLNTASAVDVRFDASQRLVFLRAGEILVRTVPDTATVHRPLLVATAHGRLEALGTYFSVHQQEDRTRLAVFEGAVQVIPRNLHASAVVVHAGQRNTFTADSIAQITETSAADIAWTRGMLMADNMRLADFIAELTRYREGFMQCDPAVADIRVSGAFPIADTNRALDMLASTYPVETRTRLRGYWVMLLPRQS